MRRKRTRLALIISLIFGLMMLGFSFVATSAFASSPTYTVMNTSESPPDGVYFRSAPHTANAITSPAGIGVYKNERVQVSCYTTGDAVGPYGNKIWYQAHNVTRPTVSGHTNSGYINTHYVNDGMTANHAASGIPKCGSTPPPPPAPKYAYDEPDGNQWCYGQMPFGEQVLEADWHVFYDGMTNGGNTTANNAQCKFTVYALIPIASEYDIVQMGDTGGFYFRTYYYVNLDWAAACKQQYPGSTLVWVNLIADPWQCRYTVK